MSQSTRLGLPYIQPQQSQKHVTANETFRRLDILVQLSVKSATLDVEPASPADGDAFILPASASGASWTSMTAGDIAAFQDGAWRAIAPGAGWRAFIEDEAGFRYFGGSAWAVETGGAVPMSVAQFGVNATADPVNRLAVKSDAALFSHDDVTPGAGDMRVVINKSGETKTGSLLFQQAFSGRAEIGLTGGDDLAFKVSDDGAAWTEAMTVKGDGKVGVNTAAPAAPFELHVDGSLTNSTLISSDDLIITKESGPPAFAGIVASASAFARMVFKGAKARGTLSAPEAAVSGDLTFTLLGAVYDGATTRGTASIEMRVDGAVSSGVAPQRIEFMTGADAVRTERMRITSGGNVGVGKTAPTTKLDVDGAVRVKSYAKAALPSASSAGAGAIVHVADEAGGSVLAFSDGAGWRRVTDRALVS